jgi:hypothetical protein
LKGSQPFTCFHRVGILLMGLEAIGVGLMFLFLSGPSLEFDFSLKFVYQRLSESSPVRTAQLLLVILVGLRFCWVALRPPNRAS